MINFGPCSASMKDNLPLLKETLQFMVQQLRPEDRLCLITFDHLVCANTYSHIPHLILSYLLLHTTGISCASLDPHDLLWQGQCRACHRTDQGEGTHKPQWRSTCCPASTARRHSW